MESFIKHLNKNNYSKNTVITYKNIIKKYNVIWKDIRNIKKELMKHVDSPNTV